MRTDVTAMLRAVGPKTRVVFLANPNNPTGSLLSPDEIRFLRRGLRDDILLILDAAYAEYVVKPGYDPGVELVSSTSNTIMIRTFSKIYGLAGFRIGWGYFPPPSPRSSIACGFPTLSVLQQPLLRRLQLQIVRASRK